MIVQSGTQNKFYVVKILLGKFGGSSMFLDAPFLKMNILDVC